VTIKKTSARTTVIGCDGPESNNLFNLPPQRYHDISIQMKPLTSRWKKHFLKPNLLIAYGSMGNSQAEFRSDR
jgi:hypothetical protein